MANPVTETISYQTHYAFERRGEGSRGEWARVGHGGGEEWARVRHGEGGRETGAAVEEGRESGRSSCGSGGELSEPSLCLCSAHSKV